jgi:hypothetical protein
MTNINIVYFIWINPLKNYKAIISGQLRDMKKSGILNESKIYIEISCQYEDINIDIHSFIIELIKDYDYEINFHSDNKYEYFGIKKLYDLAKYEPNKYYLYLHSKGMFNYNNKDKRHIYEKTLTVGTVSQFKNVIQIFNTHENISKIGLFPSNLHNQNFIWLNFFWCRGTYINTCQDPEITEDRYYYERWSGTGEKNSLTYNLYENNYKKYELNEVGDILNSLNGNFFVDFNQN